MGGVIDRERSSSGWSSDSGTGVVSVVILSTSTCEIFGTPERIGLKPSSVKSFKQGWLNFAKSRL